MLEIKDGVVVGGSVINGVIIDLVELNKSLSGFKLSKESNFFIIFKASIRSSELDDIFVCFNSVK